MLSSRLDRRVSELWCVELFRPAKLQVFEYAYTRKMGFEPNSSVDGGNFGHIAQTSLWEKFWSTKMCF